MKKTNLTALLLAATSLAAVPALATAEYRGTPQLTKLGEVDTHANDAEDFVQVPSQRFDSIVIVARDGVVPLSGLKVQYTDGKIDQPFARGFLKPGERLVVDVPSGKPIKMLVLDYNERMSSRWGDRATARVEIYGQASARQVPAYRDRDDRRRVDRRPVVIQPRYEWRGNVRVRIN